MRTGAWVSRTQAQGTATPSEVGEKLSEPDRLACRKCAFGAGPGWVLIRLRWLLGDNRHGQERSEDHGQDARHRAIVE
jgi:hypothetical protein